MRPGVLLTLSVALALGGACGGRGPAGPQGGAPAPVVEVAEVTRGTVDAGLALVGQLEADESVMIKSETSGVIESVAFREGQDVGRGAVLFRLRSDEQRARVREADAQVQVTEAAYERARSLASERILSAAEFDQALANRDAARARADLARVELARMTIRAPFAGVLGPRLVSPGDRVTDATDLVQIDAVSELKLAFPVPEPIVERVRTGLGFLISVASFPDERFPGTVYFVAPALDPRNRQLLLKGAVPNADRRLRPGMFATIRLETSGQTDVLVAPESAVVYDPMGTFVWRLAPDDTAERVPVTLGTRLEGFVQVISGLSEGDRIVSAGTNKVAAGRPVRIAGAPADATPRAGS